MPIYKGKAGPGSFLLALALFCGPASARAQLDQAPHRVPGSTTSSTGAVNTEDTTGMGDTGWSYGNVKAKGAEDYVPETPKEAAAPENPLPAAN